MLQYFHLLNFKNVYIKTTYEENIKGEFGWSVKYDTIRLIYFLSHTTVSLQYIISLSLLFLH